MDAKISGQKFDEREMGHVDHLKVPPIKYILIPSPHQNVVKSPGEKPGRHLLNQGNRGTTSSPGTN